jgi:capsular polysaccharide biosynthesis protein
MSYEVYAPKDYERFFKQSIKKLKVESDFAIEQVERGIIALDKKSIGYGVFDLRRHFVKASEQLRYNNGQFIPKKVDVAQDNIPYNDVDAVYMGSMDFHFGHFLLEHMNRAYAFIDPKYSGMKCVYVNNKRGRVPEFAWTLLELLGIKREDIIILEETTQFRNVYVPWQSLNIPILTSTQVRDIYSAIASNVTASQVYERVYLSRSALQRRRIFGEKQIEKIFEQNGYKVIHPETLSMIEQIAVLKNCKSLAGCAGSALHGALFMPDGGEVIQIKRNSIAHRDNAYVQYMINKPKDLTLTLIAGSIEDYKTEHFTETPQIIGINEYMRRFFNERGFVYSVQDIIPDALEYQEYKDTLDEYLKNNHGNFTNKLKAKFIKITSCLVPGRRNRNVFRAYLKKVL